MGDSRFNFLQKKLRSFIEEDVVAAEAEFFEHQRTAVGPARWKPLPVIEKLKSKARALGLWNLFLPKESPEGAGLTNYEYAHLCEMMGAHPLAAECVLLPIFTHHTSFVPHHLDNMERHSAFDCSAPAYILTS